MSMCACMHAQSCPTLCGPMNYSLPSFSVHGIFQARIQEWVAISFSKGSSWARGRTYLLNLLHWQADSLPAEPLGKLHSVLYYNLNISGSSGMHSFITLKNEVLRTNSLLVIYFHLSHIFFFHKKIPFVKFFRPCEVN